MWETAIAVGGKVLGKLLGGDDGPGAVEVGTRHPAINQAQLASDPLYAYAVKMANEGHRATHGVGFRTDSDSGVIAASISSAYAQLRARYGAAVPQGIYEAVGMAAPGLSTGGMDMSTSTDIRDALKQALLPVVAQAVGLGGTAATTMQLGFPQATPPFNAPTITPAALPAIGPILGGLGRAAGGLATLGAGGAMAVAAGVVRAVSGRIRGVMTAAGKFISSKRAVELAKRVGVDAAAVALGISAVEMAQMVLDSSERRSRGRGITGAQLRTTRRTMRLLTGMQRQMAQACASAKRRCR